MADEVEVLADESVFDTLDAVLEATRLLTPPMARDETLRSGFDRSPAGHPLREIISRTVKCRACGGLAPFYRLTWMVDLEEDDAEERDPMYPICGYCSSTDVTMWKQPVTGHG